LTQRRSRIGRFLAALFIRGAEAPFILRDLDDSFDHDVARGLPPAEVRRRDLRNILASAGRVWAESLRPSAWRPSGIRAEEVLSATLDVPSSRRQQVARAQAIVNTTFAQRAFGSTNPIGRRVRQVTSDRASVGPWLEVVGVVGHMGVHALTPSQDDGAYLPLAEGDANPVRLAIWVRGDPAVLAPRVHELARAVDPSAVIAMPIPLDEMFEGDWYFLRAFVVAAAVLVGVPLGLPFAGALCYEFLELTGYGRSVPGAVAMASVLGVSVMLRRHSCPSV